MQDEMASRLVIQCIVVLFCVCNGSVLHRGTSCSKRRGGETDI